MEKRTLQGHEKKLEYIKEYAKKNYKRVPLNMPFADYEALKAAADRSGESVNGYIKKAIKERIERESEK